MYEYPRLKAATMTVLTAVLAALAVFAHADRPAPAAAHAPAVHVAHAGGTAVSSTLDSSADADEAFLADLFDGAATDLTPQQAANLTAVAHRICDLDQPRTDWMASLTSGPHALTEGEAGKLYDTAEAAYCPELSGWEAPRT
jgi:hypothetical protein